MGDIDWQTSAAVHARDDAGSEMYYEFKSLAEGTLADMVRHVGALPSDEQARVVMMVTGGETLNIAQIRALGQRDDFPG